MSSSGVLALLILGTGSNFEVAAPTQETDKDQPGTLRFQVHVLLGGRTFENFRVDVGFGDPIVEKIDKLEAPGFLLSFAGIPPTIIPCLPISQQVAEKVHAYTKPYKSGEPSRVRDLADILLIGELGKIRGSSLTKAIQATFTVRNTHTLPSKLSDPPISWNLSYRRLAVTLDLRWNTLDKATEAAHLFLDPILSGGVSGLWDPTLWTWSQ